MANFQNFPIVLRGSNANNGEANVVYINRGFNTFLT